MIPGFALVEQMFDTGRMAPAHALPDGRGHEQGHELGHVLEDIAPVVLAAEKVLPIPEVFGDLFPGDGLQRGWVTRVGGGPSARAFAWALLGGVTTAGGWIASIDVPGIAMAAAREVGVAIERMMVVTSTDAESWSTAVGALIGAVDVVVFESPRHRITPSEHRRLASRARERGSVLLELASSTRFRSQLQYDLSFTTHPVAWTGLGRGHGCLRGRVVDVQVTGRRLGGPHRDGRFELPAVDGHIRRVDGGDAATVIPMR